MEYYSWYGSDDHRAKMDPPSSQQNKPCDFVVGKPLNWDEIIDDDPENENWVSPRALCSGWSRPGNGNDNGNGEGEENTLHGDKGTGKGKGTMDGNSKKMRKGKGNGKEKGIVKSTPSGDDIFHAISLQLQKQMLEEELEMEG